MVPVPVRNRSISLILLKPIILTMEAPAYSCFSLSQLRMVGPKAVDFNGCTLKISQAMAVTISVK